MKSKLLIIFSIGIIGFTGITFAEESFDGYSSIDPPLSEIISGQSTVLNIKFLYTSGPYTINNFVPIIEINPPSAKKFVQVDVDSIEIHQGQVKRIPVTLTIDPHIEHDKIFLSISFTGNHFKTDELHKSSWNDQVTLDIIEKDEPIPEPEQNIPIYENCGPGTILQDGMCVVDKIENSTQTFSDPSNCWGGPACNYDFKSPLKQIKAGAALFDVRCNEGKYLVYKSNRMMAACVFDETEVELINRGWALMRLGFPDNTRTDLSASLCGSYEGKWHPEYEGCRGNITNLQCSLMDGEFVDNLKICYDGICPVDKVYTLCVTNHDLISGEKEN